uniref:Uncharacterized protein n=1 Tax=Naja naja TaxID=35670 RepID=A0A8C6YFZ0_NAJNA
MAIELSSCQAEKRKVKNQNNLKMELGPPDVMERKGALTLRSNSAYYGRPTLVSGW